MASEEDIAKKTYKVKNVNFDLMKQLSEIIRAFPYLISVVSQRRLQDRSFPDWLVNCYTPVFLEHKLLQGEGARGNGDEMCIEKRLTLNLGMLSGFNFLMGSDE